MTAAAQAVCTSPATTSALQNFSRNDDFNKALKTQNGQDRICKLSAEEHAK